jgi:GTPase
VVCPEYMLSFSHLSFVIVSVCRSIVPKDISLYADTVCFCLLHRLCPIFQVSNVTGDNLNLLKMFLNLLTTRMISRDDEPAEFQIDDTYSVPVSEVSFIHR